MLKEIFSQRLKTQSKTVCNAIITLGDIDDSGKGKRFKSRFIQPGLAGCPEKYGNVLVRKETLDKSLNTIIGAPVIINHTTVTEENADDLRVGVISNAYYNEKDGWYWCEGVIWDETAQNLITDKKWSVSCSYNFLEQDDEGGTENNIPYDREFTKLNFVHLAIVDTPRYERAHIVFNSKTVENYNKNHDRKNKNADNSCTFTDFNPQRPEYISTIIITDNSKDFNPTEENMLNNVENKKIIDGLSNIIPIIKQSTLTNQDLKLLRGLVQILENNVKNGWITLDKTDEEGNRIKIFIDGYNANIDYKWFSTDIAEYKQTKKMKIDLSSISDKNQNIIMNAVNDIISTYKVKDFVSVSQGTLTKAYAFAITNGSENAIRVSKKLFSDTENLKKSFSNDCDNLFHPVGLKDVDPVKAVIMHELGHSITVAGKNEPFWNEIDNIIKSHNKELGASTYKKFKQDKDKLNLKNFVSSYALFNKYEFVAEAFADAKLSQTPCKYSVDVLKCINKHFKKDKGVNNMINNEKETKSEDLFLENYGLGYPNQEEFEKWEEEQSKQNPEEK